jgi:hypothetical protein
MLFIMRLFAAAAMTDDGVLGTNRAAAQDDFCAGIGPIDFEVVLRRRKWDKQNRSNEGSARPGHLAQDRQAGATPFLLNKSHLEKNNAALPPVWGKAHEVGGGKYVDFHRIGRLIRECLPP